MTSSTAGDIILDRFAQKCRMAGGLRAGFVMRRRALLYTQPDHPEVDLDAGIATLLAGGLLATNESGDFLFLTAAGVDALSGDTPAADSP